jgi:Uma2 family endonuclease
MQHPALQRRAPRLIYDVPEAGKNWELSDDQVPESRPHERRTASVFDQLDSMVERTGRNALVCRNLAVRWIEARPSIGVDPDVCLIEPAPPGGDELYSLLLWKEGHTPPVLAVEIVSVSRADKDYAQSPDKYAANGTQELWVFDPMLAGPQQRGGPFRLQVWQRDEQGDFLRVFAGEGPAHSEALGAWVFVVAEGRALRIADDAEGTSWWMTRAEAERTAKEMERTAKEAERAAKEAAELRVQRLAEKLREAGIDPETIR